MATQTFIGTLPEADVQAWELARGLESLIDSGSLHGSLIQRAWGDMLFLDALGMGERRCLRTVARIRAFWRNRFPEFFEEGKHERSCHRQRAA